MRVFLNYKSDEIIRWMRAVMSAYFPNLTHAICSIIYISSNNLIPKGGLFFKLSIIVTIYTYK